MEDVSKKAWGWYNAGNVWLPLRCNDLGQLEVDMSLISFLDLSDTPAAYAGEARSGLRVNAAENALEFDADVSRIIWKATPVIVMTDLNRNATLAWTDLDLTASTSANAKFAILQLQLRVDSIVGGLANLQVRRNGETPAFFPWLRAAAANGDAAGAILIQQKMVGLDAGQLLEYRIALAATIQVDSYIILLGYVE